MTTDKGLMVWLPLTDANHCENQGLVGKLTCITTPTFVDGGKLGKCLSTGEYQMSAAQTTKVFNNNHLTIAFWVYIDAATGASTPRSVFIGNGETNANNNRKFMIMQYPTVNDLHYYWMNDAASKFFISNTIMDALPSYKWTHVAITYENPTAIIYINGIEVRRNTGVSNSSTFAYTTPIIGNNTGRRINDFRIYSYALSPQEIKELSRGKIGHWLGNEELVTSASNKWRNGNFASGTSNYSIPYSTADNSDPTIFKITRTISSNDNNNIYKSISFTANHIYCLVAYLHSPANTTINLESSSLIDKVQTIASKNAVGGKWDYVVRIYKATDNCSGGCIFRSSATLGAVMQFKKGIGIQLYDLTELGMTNINTVELAIVNFGTSYAGHPAFLSDISGFGRHGQVVGNVTLAGDTPRYDKSLKYNGGNVVVTGLPTMSTYTISWWDKFPADTGLLFDWRLGPVDTSMDLSSAGALINNNTCYFKIGGVATGYQNYSNYDITANTWYHCCLVCDDSKSRLYINGIQKWEASKGSITDFSQLILGGKTAAANDGYQYTGQHSDFRIYATALSADDVKELYSLGH